MKATQIEIPTYDSDGAAEFDYVQRFNLTLQEADGLRVVMGDPGDKDAPDALIERGVGLWRVFVHPNAGDPLCVVEIAKGRVRVQDELGTVIRAWPFP
jgi:hypothetical protein